MSARKSNFLLLHGLSLALTHLGEVNTVAIREEPVTRFAQAALDDAAERERVDVDDELMPPAFESRARRVRRMRDIRHVAHDRRPLIEGVVPFDRRGDFIAGVDLDTRDVEQRSVPWGSGQRGA